jgi:hypothetical protein
MLDVINVILFFGGGFASLYFYKKSENKNFFLIQNLRLGGIILLILGLFYLYRIFILKY